MAAKTRVLTDHDEIRQWAEERNAKPSAVARTASEDDPGIIRLDFPGYSGEGTLEAIEWDEWFDKFDEAGLALIVQDETAEGEQSNFNKLVRRDSVESEQEPAKRSTAKKGRGARG